MKKTLCTAQEAPAQTLGAEQMAAETGGRARAAKKKPDKKVVVEVPAIFDDKTPFVPPAAYLKKCVQP